MSSTDMKKGNIVMQTNQAMPVCLLCRKNPQGEISHIFPKFIMKKLIAEGDFGRLRNLSNPNVALQDGPKRTMLCSQCEDLFSIFEKHFAEKIFHPSYNGKLDKAIGANDALSLKFLASLSFRCIAMGLEDHLFPPQYLPVFRPALNPIRDYLLGEISSLLPLFFSTILHTRLRRSNTKRRKQAILLLYKSWHRRRLYNISR